jgi:hypothetical protein
MTTLVSPSRPAQTGPQPTKAPRGPADDFYDLLAMSTPTLDRAMRERAAREYALAEPERYEAAHERLAAWLALDDEDARILAAAFDRATGSLPDEYRTQRIETERAVLMNAMTFDEFVRLASMLAWLRDEPLPTAPDVALAV